MYSKSACFIFDPIVAYQPGKLVKLKRFKNVGPKENFDNHESSVIFTESKMFLRIPNYVPRQVKLFHINDFYSSNCIEMGSGVNSDGFIAVLAI